MRVEPTLGMEGASETIDPTGGNSAAIPGRIAHDGPSFDSHKRLSANDILVSAAVADRFSLYIVLVEGIHIDGPLYLSIQYTFTSMASTVPCWTVIAVFGYTTYGRLGPEH
jgi:hypothetical protein